MLPPHQYRRCRSSRQKLTSPARPIETIRPRLYLSCRPNGRLALSRHHPAATILAALKSPSRPSQSFGERSRRPASHLGRPLRSCRARRGEPEHTRRKRKQSLSIWLLKKQRRRREVNGDVCCCFLYFPVSRLCALLRYRRSRSQTCSVPAFANSSPKLDGFLSRRFKSTLRGIWPLIHEHRVIHGLYLSCHSMPG